jgi:hypothetical protein
LEEEAATAPKRLSVLTEQIGTSTTIRPVGRIDVSGAWTLGDSLRRIIERPQTASGSERHNLLEEVEPGETYRDVRVRWRAAAKIRPKKARKRREG